MHIVFIGIQGSGKGTQARKLVDRHSYELFEMWVQLRAYSQLSEPHSWEVKTLIEGGSLVRDDLIAEMLLHYQSTIGKKNVIFDGIPRTLPQLEMFGEVIKDFIVISLDLSQEEALKRIAWRRVDSVTGESFPADFRGEYSPLTGNRLVKRADDTPEAAQKRIGAFFERTLPLLDAWRSRGKMAYSIDASRSAEEVESQISAVLSAYLK